MHLSPYLDEGDIVRVDGRIDGAAISNLARHQIVLPGKHYLVNLLIKSFHDRTHNGTEYILAELRQIYWILNARTSIKKVAWQCFNCRKLKSKAVTLYMSNLPTFRMEYQRPPFTDTSLDFFDPMFIKQRRSRLKRWGCLFACMVTRAVLLELVESLDTDSFINALQRFINRRGKPNTLLSGCGSNFKGATRALKFGHQELNQDKITYFTDQQNIKWKFNPPSSPHMRGQWERLVRVVKLSLLHVIKNRILTDFQMMTVFTEVENIVNNRPLTANSDNVKVFEALTHNHFLIRRNFCNNNHLGETRISDLCSRKRWRQVQLLPQHFWRRWLKEYLPT